MIPKHYLFLAILVSTCAAILIIKDYIIPQGKGKQNKILQGLLLLHAFRFVGLSMYFPGVVSSELPAQFIDPTVWGDYIAAILAIIAYILLGKEVPKARVFVWIFNIWGLLDIVYAGYQAAIFQIAEHIEVMFFVFSAYAPLLLASHVMIFQVLVRKRKIEYNGIV
ncbi:MAG: hypothetical protein AAF518_17370 [Spirochaetota bacterium]